MGLIFVGFIYIYIYTYFLGGVKIGSGFCGFRGNNSHKSQSPPGKWPFKWVGSLNFPSQETQTGVAREKERTLVAWALTSQFDSPGFEGVLSNELPTPWPPSIIKAPRKQHGFPRRLGHGAWVMKLD